MGPGYETNCGWHDNFWWHIWLIAKEHSWASFEALIDFWFRVLNYDMQGENRLFSVELLVHFAMSEPEQLKELKTKHDARVRYWDYYWVDKAKHK